MRIAVVHYHFKPGGVTRVVDNAVEALKPHGHELIALAGEVPAEPHDYPILEVPDLRYAQPGERIDPVKLVKALRRAASDALGAQPDVWHVHNHSLGKNAAVTDAVSLLAEEAPVLLQIHDFAEDGRPSNYALLRNQMKDLQTLYPVAPHIHYAVLNGRDYRVLKTAGIPEESLHMLANAVSVPDIPVEAEPLPELEGRKLVLYPTRSIRRKNMGEFLLHAALATDDTRLAATLGPNNPTARPIYERWLEFAKEQKISAIFGMGEGGHSFENLMANASAIITTSVAEGFGLAFLEPFLFDKPLMGRDLPEVTGEFREAGVNLDSLYPHLSVPVDWIEVDAFRARLANTLAVSYDSYGVGLPSNGVGRAWNAAQTQHGKADFGRLDETAQENVLRVVVSSASAREDLRQQLPPLDTDSVDSNHAVVKKAFSLTGYGEHLSGIYASLRATEPGSVEAIPPDVVLHEFLKPERFMML